MAGKPKIEIESCTGFRFRIYAGNNYNRPLGQSAQVYSSEEECMKAKDAFVDFVLKHKLTREDKRYVKIIEYGTGSNCTYGFQYFNENGELMFEREKKYAGKSGAVNGIKIIFSAISSIKEISD